MLLFFGFQNWMSFPEPTGFSMLATPVRRHRKRLAAIPFRHRVLPVSMLFGGNASGKSNFIDALDYLRGMATGHLLPRDGVPFVLDPALRASPSFFQLDFLADDHILRYALTVDRQSVLQESLHRIVSHDGEESPIFLREGRSLSAPGLKTDDERTLRQALGKGQLDEKTLLSRMKDEPGICHSAHAWFDESLDIRNSRFGYKRPESVTTYLAERPYLLDLLNQLLPLLDNGIERLKFEGGEDGDRPVLCSLHRDWTGEEIRLPLRHESAGVRQLLEILPPLALATEAAAGKTRILVIDEWDRNFHSLLSLELLNFYLQRQNDAMRTQLILSSHDLTLLNRELFRTDELWVTERTPEGASQLFPLSDFASLQKGRVNYRQLYMDGRLGGLPNLNAFILTDWPARRETDAPREEGADHEG